MNPEPPAARGNPAVSRYASNSPIALCAYATSWLDNSWSILATDGYRYSPQDFAQLVHDQEKRGHRWGV